MEETNERNEVYSKSVRAGKRTYFFDVKATRSEEFYITITESKKRFNNDNGKFYYEKHKIFLYREDFEKFTEGLEEVMQFIQTGTIPEIDVDSSGVVEKEFSEVDFEDLERPNSMAEKTSNNQTD